MNTAVNQQILRFSHPLWSLLAGGMAIFAFAPFDYTYLALLAPLVVFLTWERNSSALASFFSGWLYSVGVFSSAGYWLYLITGRLGDIPSPLAEIISFIFISVMGLYLGISALLYHCLKSHLSLALRALFLFPALWGLGDWLRGWVMTGFPWFSLGYTQLNAPLAGWIPIVGVYGVNILLAMTAGALVLASNRCYSRHAILFIVTLWLAGVLLQKIDWTEATGEKLSVALIQTHLQDLSYQQEISELRQRTLAAWQQADLVVWPEAQSTLHAVELDNTGTVQLGQAGLETDRWQTQWLHTGRSETGEPFALLKSIETELFTPLEKIARTQNKYVLLSVLSRDNQRDQLHNSLLLLDGKQRYLYDKRHLAPFGELIPLRTTLSAFWDWVGIKDNDFSQPRRALPLLPLGQNDAGVSICYESAFGEEIAQALPQAGLLLMSSSDAKFVGTTELAQHHQVVQARAMETERWVARATTTGVTAIINAKGKEIARLNHDKEGVLYDEIPLRNSATPYAMWKNAPVVIFIVFMLVYGFILKRALKR